jgi:putative transposase
MSRDTTVIPLRQPEAIDDPLTEVAREGARRMLAQVLIAEADAFVAQWKDLKLPDGRDRVVRHGHGPQRAIQTGVGPIEVRRSKVRDRADVDAEEKIRFTSSILPKWARRTKSLDALLPILYPARGIDRRLPGGAHRPPGQGCAEPVCGGDLATNGAVAG